MKVSKFFVAALIVGTGVFTSSAAFAGRDNDDKPKVDPCACKATATSFVKIGEDISTSSAVGKSAVTFANLGNLDSKKADITIGLTGAAATVGENKVKTGNSGLNSYSEVY